MGSDAEGRPFAIFFALLALSLLLVVVGFVLRGRGHLATRNAALGWAILSILPLFGAGAVFFAKHAVQEATGVTEPGVNGNALAPDHR